MIHRHSTTIDTSKLLDTRLWSFRSLSRVVCSVFGQHCEAQKPVPGRTNLYPLPPPLFKLVTPWTCTWYVVTVALSSTSCDGARRMMKGPGSLQGLPEPVGNHRSVSSAAPAGESACVLEGIRSWALILARTEVSLILAKPDHLCLQF